MRYLELLVTDLTDATEPDLRTEWIHRDHIETIEPYTTPRAGRHMLWLALTLTSGRIRYLPLHPVDPAHANTAARSAITALLDTDTGPLRAATLTNPDDEPATEQPDPRTWRP